MGRRAGIIIVMLCLLLLIVAGSASAATVNGGSARLYPDNWQANYLGDQSIFAVPMAPMTISASTWTWTYSQPVMSGSVSLLSLTGTVRMQGGLRYAEVGTIHSGVGRLMFTLTDWRVVLGSSPRITALVNDLTRQSVFDLTTNGVPVKRWVKGSYRYVRLSGVPILFRNESIALFSGTFGVFAGLAPGERWGTMGLTMRFPR